MGRRKRNGRNDDKTLEVRKAMRRGSPGPVPRYSFEEVRDAIVKSHGNLTRAAQRLRLNRSSICNYIDRDPALREYIAQGIEEINDYAEDNFVEAITSGKDLDASKRWLEARGSHRGWGRATTPQAVAISQAVAAAGARVGEDAGAAGEGLDRDLALLAEARSAIESVRESE